MKLIIENYIDESNLILNPISEIFGKHLLFKNLDIKDNIVTVPFNYDNSIVRIFSSNNSKNIKVFKFFKDDKLVYTKEDKECVIKITNGKINEYSYDEFRKNRGPLVSSQNKFVILQWNVYWYYLHWLTFNYPENPTKEDEEQIIDLVTKMRTSGIRCGKCRGHFDEWLNKNDIKPSLKSKDKLFEYFFILHNDVNERNNKKIFTLEEAINLYKEKDWNLEFKKYGVDILSLLKERNLGNFTKLFYTVVEKNVRDITGLDRALKHLQSLEKEGVEITDNKINTDNNKKSVIIVNNKVQSNVNKILVEKGWNLIGTKDTISLDTQHIEDNLIYLYDNGYKLVRTLFPGNGYWIKSKIDGYINFTIN